MSNLGDTNCTSTVDPVTCKHLEHKQQICKLCYYDALSVASAESLASSARRSKELLQLWKSTKTSRFNAQ